MALLIIDLKGSHAVFATVAGGKKSMKQYKLSFPIQLENTSGGFCMTPLSIMNQMDDARKSALKSLRAFIKSEGVESEVRAITSPAEGGINIWCSENVAAKLKTAPFLNNVEEIAATNQNKPKAPPFRKAGGF